jgi:hypothetical protein
LAACKKKVKSKRNAIRAGQSEFKETIANMFLAARSRASRQWLYLNIRPRVFKRSSVLVYR